MNYRTKQAIALALLLTALYIVGTIAMSIIDTGIKLRELVGGH